MLILLPPSEGKTAPKRGKPVDLATLSQPSLTSAREHVLGELTGLCGGDPGTARSVLGLSAGQLGEIAVNAALRQAPAAPAAKVYTGVLYEALDHATLTPAAQRWAKRRVLVFSALWGMVGLADRIPAYRCNPAVKLPGLQGALGSYWRRELAVVHSGQFVVDLRSGPYAAMWKPRHAVAVRVLHDGKVVSHFNKAAKGRLVRDLALDGVDVKDASDLADTLRDLKYDVALTGQHLDVTITTIA